MSYLRHLDPTTREAVRKAKKTASAEAHARKVARARDALKTAEDKFRKPRARDGAYLSWLRRAPCLVCAIKGEPQTTRTEAAHVRRAYPEPGWRPVGGAEKPSDTRAICLCAEHHRTGPDAQHAEDSAAWYERHGIYPPEVCAKLKAAQESGADPIEVVQGIAAEINGRGCGE